jgi:hypothetical protein
VPRSSRATALHLVEKRSHGDVRSLPRERVRSSAHRRQPSDRNALDFIEADLIAPTIVELRRARRRMVRHGRGLLERAAVFQIGRDSGCPEAVVAELGFDAGCGRTPADHCVPRIL